MAAVASPLPLPPLPCSQYHARCVDEWLANSSRCPLCNTSVTVVLHGHGAGEGQNLLQREQLHWSSRAALRANALSSADADGPLVMG